MAFTGSATIKKVGDNLLRITGLSLAASAAGTIGLFGGGGEVDLPDDPTNSWKPYGDVALVDSVQVTVNPVTDVAGYDEALRVVKAGAGDDFLITITNDDGDVASPGLEIYVRFH